MWRKVFMMKVIAGLVFGNAQIDVLGEELKKS